MAELPGASIIAMERRSRWPRFFNGTLAGDSFGLKSTLVRAITGMGQRSKSSHQTGRGIDAPGLRATYWTNGGLTGLTK